MAVAEKTATQSLRLTLTCADRTGLVSTVASVLFDLGADLGDTSFTILGSSAQLSTVFDIAADVDVREIHNALEAIDILQDATLRLESTLPDTTVQSPETTVTHRVIVSGGDRPGLIARLSEGFGEFGANIVRMDSKRLEEAEGMRYAVRFEVAVPKEREMACLATAKNTAEELGLSCTYESLEPTALP